MAEHARVVQLLKRLAPYWAGEQLVIDSYWHWSGRSRETDRRWLARQCWKEIWGSGVAHTREGLLLGAARALVDGFDRIDVDRDRHSVLAAIDDLRDEFAHYCAFADVHDALARPEEPRLTPRDLVGWPEDDALAELRYAHKRDHPTLGARAARITEGGFGALYRSGMQLGERSTAAHGHADALIAAACRSVHADEVRHMGVGWRALDDDALPASDWQLLEEMALAQARLRIDMRNAQFERPLTGDQLATARAGDCLGDNILALAEAFALTR